MDKHNKNLQMILILVGVLGTLALVYFAYKQTSNASDSSGSPYPVITSAPVDQVGLANAQIGMRSAELQAKTSAFQSLVNLVLGKDTNRANTEISQINADANTEMAKLAAESSKYSADAQAGAIRYASEKDAWVREREAFYTNQTAQKQSKDKKTSSIWGTIGGIAGGILSLF